ncbi:hypothetical protein [Hymenobacter properus]|uniref:Uncharacterized protein n=1 Tax=Hymenobacter properus TaxID=2791026 RepID=A0A931BDA9_9BACT|nr:hypothetical protein [Hymenobacter properus]MBF9140481.1 hypothetical protein [Hymenobacter properus]MBR7719288.1 hypothetical protein [Microvirga sp. SRT04]
MKLELLLAAGLALTGLHVQAQIVNNPAVQRDYSKVGSNEFGSLTDLTNGAQHLLTRSTKPGTLGSPYADNRWLAAEVTLNNKLPIKPFLMKYDVLEHRLLMYRPAPANDSIELDDHQVAAFVLSEPASNTGPARQRLFRRFTEATVGSQHLDYVEVLHAGRYTLLKHFVKTIKKPSFQGMYSDGAPVDEIEDAPEYFLKAPDGPLTPVKLSTKSLQAAAPPLAAALKTAVSAQKPYTEAGWASVLDAADPAAAK